MEADEGSGNIGDEHVANRTDLETPRRRNLAPAIRASLNAKLERLLSRPIIAEVVDPEDEGDDGDDDDDVPAAFLVLQRVAADYAPAATVDRRMRGWRDDPEDGTCSVRVWIDYDDLWRGREKEILEAMCGTVEGEITFLTDEQRMLLERSPREFLELHPRPECAELVSFEKEDVGGGQRVVGLRLASAPASREHVKHVAIVPNLVQIQRQLDALHTIETSTDDGPLAPLRALLGVCDAAHLPTPASDDGAPVDAPMPGERLDEYQVECVRKAMTTPHFAVIQGPPGSGKTTVITGIIRRALGKGERVLVVSPTHVAVDNVVEKLTSRCGADAEDRLDPSTLPVRYSARRKKLSEKALSYWVGSKKQRRGATIANRIRRRLAETIPFAEALYAIEDADSPGHSPLSAAVARSEAVICGTPIGILSYDPVKNAGPGSFELLIVDEVSKMTLPEFFAIAVKARRWILVGDPEQLPPFNNAEENATTLDDLLDPILEIACSVGAVLERVSPALRHDERLVVVSSVPDRAAAVTRAHLDAVMLRNVPAVTLFEEAANGGIVFCGPKDAEAACRMLSPVREHDRSHNPDQNGTVGILAERGLAIARPAFASGSRLVEPRKRAQAVIFENAFNVYHAQPWAERSGQKLRLVSYRNGLDKYLPSPAAVDLRIGGGSRSVPHAELISAIAERFAVNTVSVYDWLTGIPTTWFDVSPLRDLEALSPVGLCEAVRPFVGTLKKQYRMHSSLSAVPRDLFYFGEALHDGKPDAGSGCRVRLVQAGGDRGEAGESNGREVDVICDLLGKLNAAEAKERPGIMVITPYREQEARLAESVEKLHPCGAIANLDVEVCTLDRCQGREAEYVFISLVRSRASHFLDMPKRWNVALTRAMQGLFIVGNIDAYLAEAQKARRDPRAQLGARGRDGRLGERPLMSLLARIIEGYDQQITEAERPSARRAAR